MFDDVPPEWCAPTGEATPVSIPLWIAPRLVERASAAPREPLTLVPSEPAAPVEPAPTTSRAPEAWTVANEGGPPSRAAGSRRAGPAPAALTEEIEKLHAALIDAIAVGLRARREALAAAERDLVHLALAIAGKVVGREVACDPSIVTAWARQGIAALGERDHVTVAISPDLAQRIPPATWAQALDGAEPVVDPALPPGTCEVRGAYGRVDAGLASRLSSVAEALEDGLPAQGEEAA
jgi:flagellar assembly protein FliH